MSRPIKAVFAILIIIVIVLAGMMMAAPHFPFGGSFDYAGAQITPDVIQRCPAYVRIGGARILHVHNEEGMTGGQMTVQFELPAGQLPAFLAGSPLRNAHLESESVPGDFSGPSWLPPERYNALQRNKTFSAGSLSVGRIYSTILIDRSRSDVYIIYLQSTS